MRWSGLLDPLATEVGRADDALQRAPVVGRHGVAVMQGRDIDRVGLGVGRLTDVAGNVVKDILA